MQRPHIHGMFIRQGLRDSALLLPTALNLNLLNHQMWLGIIHPQCLLFTEQRKSTRIDTESHSSEFSASAPLFLLFRNWRDSSVSCCFCRNWSWTMHSHSGGIIYLNPFHIHPLSSLSQIFSIQFRYLFRTPSDCLCKYSAAGINVLSISHIANSLLVHTWPTLSHHRMEPPAHSLINSYRISCDFLWLGQWAHIK